MKQPHRSTHAGQTTGDELFLTPPLARLWQGQDPFAAAAALTGKVYRQFANRRTLRSELVDKLVGELASVGCFVKLHQPPGWRRFLADLVRLRPFSPGADAEYRAIRRLEELDVPTLSVLAYGKRGRLAAQTSFLISAEIAPSVSLEDFCAGWQAAPPAPALRHALIRQLATMVRRMHQGGVNHRDLYLCHFLLHLDPAPTPAALRLYLIDLHRAQLRDQTPPRWRDKDLAALYFSALQAGLTRRDCLRFLRSYFSGRLSVTLRREAALLQRLEKRGQQLLRRYARRFVGNTR